MRQWSVEVREPGDNVVDELWSSLLQKELTSRIPLGVLMPRIIILSPVLQTSVAVEAFHAISDPCAKCVFSVATYKGVQTNDKLRTRAHVINNEGFVLVKCRYYL